MKNHSIILSAICLLLISATFSSVFAENLNLPDGQKIDYFSQGEGIIAVPAGALYAAGVYSAGPLVGQAYPQSPETTLKIVCNDGEGGSFGSADNIIIFQQFQGDEGLEYIPMAWLIASSDPTEPNAQVTFYREFLSGTPAGVVLQISPTITIANTKAVSDTVLNVERHGNSISAQLTTPLTGTQRVMYATGVGIGVLATIPSFSVEFNKVGGNVHKDVTNYLDPAHGLSGYTQIVEASGFAATGHLTGSSPRWLQIDTELTDCSIAMHEISTYIPPNLP